MILTVEQGQKIRFLSDGELYDKAIDFAKRHLGAEVSKTQLSGLQNTVGAGDLAEIFRYVDNRLERDTIYRELRDFYLELKTYLTSLREKVEEIQLVVRHEEMTRAETQQVKSEINRFAHILAQEFIQHLVAEYNYQRRP